MNSVHAATTAEITSVSWQAQAPRSDALDAVFEDDAVFTVLFIVHQRCRCQLLQARHTL